jgi:hypothetical protein
MVQTKKKKTHTHIESQEDNKTHSQILSCKEDESLTCAKTNYNKLNKELKQ